MDGVQSGCARGGDVVFGMVTDMHGLGGRYTEVREGNGEDPWVRLGGLRVGWSDDDIEKRTQLKSVEKSEQPVIEIRYDTDLEPTSA